MAAAAPINTASKRTLLQMISNACNEIGIIAPSFIIGNTDPQIAQLLALANREGRDFSVRANKNGGWQELRQEYTFNTAGVGNLTGDIIDGSAVITNITSTTDIVVGYIATGNGIPTLSAVLSVDSPTQVTLNTNATETSTGVSLSFGQQAYSLPSDFGYFIQQTFWDRAFRWQLLGPLEAQEWQVLKSGISPTGPRRRFRIMNNQFYIDPVPSEVDQEVFEYYSNTGWCQSRTGVAQTAWTADTDYYTLDDDSMEYGLQWRFKAKKGLDYTQEYRDYMICTERALARNGGTRNLPLNATASGTHLLSNNNVPDTGFGS